MDIVFLVLNKQKEVDFSWSTCELKGYYLDPCSVRANMASINKIRKRILSDFISTVSRRARYPHRVIVATIVTLYFFSQKLNVVYYKFVFIADTISI